MVKIDLVGQRFERLVVVSESDVRKNGQWAWNCKCDCGGEAVVASYDLRKGHTQSCGCLQKERTSKAKKTHGRRHTREYGIWTHMWRRCRNPNSENFERYGARGITVCDRWKDFGAFYTDMGDAPEGHSIERVNNNGDYTPENCIWADNFAQAQNKRMRKDNLSGVVGVCEYDGQWFAYMDRNKVRRKTGYFTTKEEAVEARKMLERSFESRPLGENSDAITATT